MAVEITPLEAHETSIDGLVRLTPKTVTDDRGTVREFFRTSDYAAAGMDVPQRWAQVNLTFTAFGGVRGLHGEAADKLIGLASGTAFGAWLDARPHSPTYGEVYTYELTVGTEIFVPSGVCNGFQATSPDGCQYLYCFGAEWVPGMAGVAVTPTDPDLGIAWPIPLDSPQAIMSAKDAAAPRFSEI